jgi:hypothetical protein
LDKSLLRGQFRQLDDDEVAALLDRKSPDDFVKSTAD